MIICCNLPDTAASISCQTEATCTQSAPFGASLSDAPSPSSAVEASGFDDASIPSSAAASLYWQSSPPWSGFCLSGNDAGEPIGCLGISLSPGVGANLAQYWAPADPRWDAYRLCYGAAPCQEPNDLDDSSVTLTPATDSCCGPVEPFSGGTIEIDQEIPGVPPPVVIYGPDGGVVPYFADDGGDTFGGPPSTCATAYNEPSNCGQPPALDGGGQSPNAATQAATSDASSASAIDADTAPGCSVGSPSGYGRSLVTVAPILGLMLARRRRATRGGDRLTRRRPAR